MAVDSDSHMAADSDSHMTADCDSHMAEDSDSHMAAGCDSHMAGDWDSLMAAGSNSHMAADSDSHIEAVMESCVTDKLIHYVINELNNGGSLVKWTKSEMVLKYLIIYYLVLIIFRYVSWRDIFMDFIIIK